MRNTRNHGDTTQAPGLTPLGPGAIRVPGVLVVFAGGRPRARVFRWEGTPLELGRLELAEDDQTDAQISRKHVELSFRDDAWHVTDLASRNGVFVSGEPLARPQALADRQVVRVGGALLLPVANTLEINRYGIGLRDGIVSGPALRRALETVATSQSTGILRSLMISGESGSGKEIAAKVFHASGPNPQGPFVAVNCATIPKDLAERLLFGSRRGAFSGATDAPGHVQAAHGGTLFLDEIAELPLDVQAKLLRMLETYEVLRLGATSAEQVDVRVCAATWRDLRKEVSRGRFREDLYFRIGQPEVRLPPLRERVEEIPWHIEDVSRSVALPLPVGASATFVEACLLRPWPGNVRELRAEVRRALAVACARKSSQLGPEDLAQEAGRALPQAVVMPASNLPSDEIAEALTSEAGNVVAAARRLGVHRNKVRRWLERHGIDASRFRPDSA